MKVINPGCVQNATFTTKRERESEDLWNSYLVKKKKNTNKQTWIKKREVHSTFMFILNGPEMIRK